MARLEAPEIAWMQDRFKRWMAEALQPPPPELPADKAPSDADLTAYSQKVAVYNSNPVRQQLTQLEAGYPGIKAKEISPSGDLILQGGNPRDQALFQRGFEAFKKQRLGFTVEGSNFQLDKIEGINLPSLNVNDVPGMLSNPGGILNMFNPLTWISSIGKIIWSVAKQIPMVDDFGGAISEMLSGRDFSMKNGRIRQAAERMLSHLPEQERAIAVDGLMSEYIKSDGKLSSAPQTPAGTNPNPTNGNGVHVPDGTTVTPLPVAARLPQSNARTPGS